MLLEVGGGVFVAVIVIIVLYRGRFGCIEDEDNLSRPEEQNRFFNDSALYVLQ